MPGSNEPQMPRRIKVDMAELEFAFDNSSDDVSSFLDLETGEVISLTNEITNERERIYKEIYGEEKEPNIPFEGALERRKLSDWMKEAVLEAHLVEEGFGERFIRVPHADSYEDYEDIEAFIETVTDVRLRNQLQLAIDGRGAFRRFRDMLDRYPKEENRWYQFKSDRLRKRILKWLKDQEIELLLD